ncbi:uncharacterized protein LOC143577598 [Bidens hawaiensis]|uniref:uncharacterized protein LOC143577598 n=1 Tax=Bidens hawaiensis TaxID=980011 RepID=UPI004049B4E1
MEKEVCNTQLIMKKAHVVNSKDQIEEEEESHSEETFEEVIKDLQPKVNPFVEDPPTLELKELPKHLEYAFVEGKSQLFVIISSDLSSDEKERLFEVLKSHKKAIAWKFKDIKGISPLFCTHKILMEENFKPVVQHQRRLNSNMQDVVKKEVLDLLNAGLIYPIFDSPWLSFTTWLRIQWKYSWKISFGDSFNLCLENLKRMLARCEEANLVLNWEKCHFMFEEGVVLRHKISQARLEVDRSKIESISKLPPPTSVKVIQSFLGHAGFYRRFIKDFSKIAKSMTQLLEKDAPLIFSEKCLDAFQILKKQACRRSNHGSSRMDATIRTCV